jgi:hypothetical protein
MRSTAGSESCLHNFVDLEFARRLEMAEMILPDCFEALRRYDPTQPLASITVAGGIAFCAGPESGESNCWHRIVW